jgi:hypothetical protein
VPDATYAAIGWEEQMYANTTGPGFALHSEIVMPYLLHYGSEHQQNEFLPPLITGDVRLLLFLLYKSIYNVVVVVGGGVVGVAENQCYCNDGAWCRF